AGFNSAGIANSGGAGKLIAEWIVGGGPQSDLADVDLRRFGAFWRNKRALAERTGETLGLHYAMRWPRQELETARPLRTSPLYDLLAAKGAVFGAKNGWERANYFVRADAGQPAGAPRTAYPHTLGRPHWLDDVIAEQKATRERVALFDQTSFGKLLLQCRDAAPNTADRLEPERLRFSATADIDVGFARVRAARMSYVAGPGFELYVPTETARHVWLALHAAGADLGLADAGYYALDALRI